MSVDPRTPVVVGVGELTHRGDVVDPITLAVEAARRAIDDTGTAALRRIDTVATPGILLIHRDNPANRIGDALGLPAGRRISCPVGGNTPQYLVEVLGRDIMRGSIDAVLSSARRAGRPPAASGPDDRSRNSRRPSTTTNRWATSAPVSARPSTLQGCTGLTRSTRSSSPPSRRGPDGRSTSSARGWGA